MSLQKIVSLAVEYDRVKQHAETWERTVQIQREQKVIRERELTINEQRLNERREQLSKTKAALEVALFDYTD